MNLEETNEATDNQFSRTKLPALAGKSVETDTDCLYGSSSVAIEFQIRRDL